MRKYLLITALMPALLALGCAGTKYYKSGRQAAAAQDWERAVAEYTHALKEEPGNRIYRLQLLKALHEAAYKHVTAGQKMAEAKDYKGAVAEYQKAIEYEPSNQFAVLLLKTAQEAMNAPPLEPGATPETQAVGPQVKQLPDTPVNLDFKNANIKDIIRALGKYGDVNFVFDDSVADKNFSITLQNVSFDKALTAIMVSTHHFFRILDPSTILIAQDNPMKRRQIEQEQIRTFYVSNADLNEMRGILQQTIQVKFVGVNTALGAITVRDTPEKLRVVERLIEANDKSKGEVLLELEIIEVNRQKVQQFGLDLGTNAAAQPTTVTGAFSPEGSTGGIIRGRDFLTANSLDYVFTLPTVAYKLLLSDADSKVIANPKLRGVEGKPMSLKMGDRVPIPVTTFTPIAGGGAAQQPITSFQYENIGINLDVTPKIHRNNEITLEMKLDISAISGTGFGGLPTFGNRQVNATMRLREGESNLLGGLLREEERKVVSGLPGIMNVPFIGKLFSYNDKRKTQTDIVLSLTPHIIRLPMITEEDRQPMWVGTEENPSPMASLQPMRGPMGREEPSFQPGEEPGRMPRHGRGGPEEPPMEEAPGPEEEPPPEVPQGGRAALMLSPTSSEVALNAQFSIALNVVNAENVGSANITLRYDPEFLRLQEANVQEGSFMKEGGGQTSFFKTVDSASGTLTIGITRSTPGKGASGSGNLITLVFEATSEGSCSVDIERATLTNAQFQPIAADISSVSDVDIYSEEGMPEEEPLDEQQ
ncbi:MAG: cohesin domain-containing protein [Acidobacteriota bacterium]